MKVPKVEIIFMRLVVVSNRLPFTASFQEGSPQFKPNAGGLTTGLWSYLGNPSAVRRMLRELSAVPTVKETT